MIKYTTENLELAFAEYGKKKSFTDWSTKITYIYRWLNEKLKKKTFSFVELRGENLKTVFTHSNVEGIAKLVKLN